jgi:Nucleotidyltransferase domain
MLLPAGPNDKSTGAYVFLTIPTTTQTLALDALLARLAAHPAVDGVVVMGSAGHGTLNPTSDYDLYVVLSAMPQPLFMLLTTVDQRLTEVYFTTTEVLDHLLALQQPTPGDFGQARATQWLQDGRIAFDRAGRLDRLRRKVQTDAWREMARGNEIRLADIYTYWWKINYNLRQTRRMLTSDDPVYLMAVDIRLLYSLPEVFVGYARARRMPWRGEKELIRYLQQHDQAFLDLFRGCITETDRVCKADLYERAAALALAPVGGLWPPEATSVQIHTDLAFYPTQIEHALTFWQSLIGD